MEYTYIPTEYEIKLMILYTVKEVKMPSSYTLIDFVISSCANVNYFELEPHITDLLDSQNLKEYISDGERYYVVHRFEQIKKFSDTRRFELGDLF